MDEQILDLKLLFKALTSHILPIMAAAVAAAMAGFMLAEFIVPKQYESKALLYVENSSGKTDDSININDISAAQKLVNTCQILFTSDYILNQLKTEAQLDGSIEDIHDMISVSSVNGTEVLSITVRSESPEEAVKITDTLVSLSQKEFTRVIKNGSIEVVSEAEYPDEHTFPKTPYFVVIGFALGLVGAYVTFLIIDILDVKVNDDDDLAEIYDIPVFAEIMDFETVDKGGYKYESYQKYAGEEHTK